MEKGSAQQKFLEFLQLKQKKLKSFTRDEVIQATGWKPDTFKTYFSKGQITQFVSIVENKKYEAINTLDISFTEFKKKLSQSKHYQELGHKCKSSLAKALLKKSRDNMMLALELYNRPSLENKLDGFVMLFSTSWEQLMKAVIIESDGEKGIYKPTRKRGFKETISLRDCLNNLFKESDQIRKNVERIADWRDSAIHLLMPELQGIASRVFQSGILNYSSYFEQFCDTPFLSSQHSGMLSLVGDFKLPPLSLLKSYYGSAADEILALAESVENEIAQTNDIEFAIPINVSLVYAKDGDTIIATASGKSEDLKNLKNALIVHKTINPEESHPLTQAAAIKEINKKLYEKYDKAKIERCLVSRNKKSGEYEYNPNCFQSCLHGLKWKKSNNEFHYYQALANKHIFSHDCIEEIVKRITKDEGYLARAKQSYNSK
jgi:hypothetical protein